MCGFSCGLETGGRRFGCVVDSAALAPPRTATRCTPRRCRRLGCAIVVSTALAQGTLNPFRTPDSFRPNGRRDQPGQVFGRVIFRPFDDRPCVVCWLRPACEVEPRRCGTVRPRSEWSIAQSESWRDQRGFACHVRQQRSWSAREHATTCSWLFFGATLRGLEGRAARLSSEIPSFCWRLFAPRVRAPPPGGRWEVSFQMSQTPGAQRHRLAGSQRKIPQRPRPLRARRRRPLEVDGRSER